VAVKVLRPELACDNEILGRFFQEARAVNEINHPNIVDIIDYGHAADDLFYFTMEYLDGETVGQRIERIGISVEEGRRILMQCASALAASHNVGIIHRDLKPENVLITSGSAVKVVDFGIAQVDGINTRLTRPGEAVGTPAYMAPEQLVGGNADERTDIYALGVMLTEMLTGQHPLAAGVRPALSSATGIAWRCMQVDAKERYQSAREVLEALEAQLRNPPRIDMPAIASSRWWWEFHQAAVSVVYAGMLWPTWIARDVIGGRQGNAVFVAVLAAAIVGVTLRLHLWFTSRFYPAELRWARGRATGWMLASDALFAAALVIAGALVGDARPAVSALEIAVGIAAASAFALIEPATTRAAFRGSDRL
jgi:hypothetical protein